MVLNSIMKKIYSKGFTLLELIVTIAMISIVAAVGIPSYRGIMITNELADTVNNMRMSMKLARSEAITRGVSTIMCSSTDASSCSLVDGDWNKGWIVGIDLNGNGQVDEAGGELLWANVLDSSSQITITPSDPAVNQKLQYSYDGWVTAGVVVGFDICTGYPVDGYPRREIRASVAGDPKITKNLGVQC